jgi:hypothetical protein
MEFLKRNAADIHLISKAARGDSLPIQREISLGEVEFFSLGLCHFVTRTEHTIRGKELVIVCAQGRNLVAPLQFIINRATSQNYQSIRYHPATKASGKALARMGGRAVSWFNAGYYITDLRGHHGQ